MGRAARRVCLAVALLAGTGAAQPTSNLAGAGRAAFELFKHISAMREATAETTTTFTTTLHHFAKMLPVDEASKQIVGALASDCERIPTDVTRQWERSQCSANATEAMEIAAFMMTTMQQSPGHQASKEEEMVMDMGSQLMQTRVHAMTERFCNHPECLEGLHLLVEHNSECFADGICAGMAQAMPFEVCRKLVRASLINTADAEMDSMCVVEPSSGMYCPEMNTLLMTKHFECWSQMHQPSKGCSPECTAVWKGFRSKYPRCSTQFALQVARSQSMASRTFSAAGVQGLGDLLTRSHHEVCSDLDAPSDESISSRVGQVAEDLASMAGAMSEVAGFRNQLATLHV